MVTDEAGNLPHVVITEITRVSTQLYSALFVSIILHGNAQAHVGVEDRQHQRYIFLLNMMFYWL